MVSNEARISKLFGSLSRKGEDTEERPHRRSRLLEVPDTIEPVDPMLFKAVTDPTFQVAPPRRAVRRSSFRGSPRPYSGKSFDVEDLLDRAGIRYGVAHKGGATLYHLHECPIDSSHDKGTTDTTVFEDAGGKLGFRCLHNRCQGHNWHSARERLEAMAR